jgi:hypothetical protein
VDLADLEKGKPLLQNHIQFGPHIAVYLAAVYSCKLNDKDKKNPPIDYSIYPIISHTNPMLAEWEAALAQKDGNDRVPQLTQLAVLIKTDKFKHLQEIPQQAKEEAHITGLVINRIRSLEADEAKLIHEQFPRVDLDRVLLLEEGRRPTTGSTSIGLMAGGAFLILVVAYCYFHELFGRKRSASGRF